MAFPDPDFFTGWQIKYYLQQGIWTDAVEFYWSAADPSAANLQTDALFLASDMRRCLSKTVNLIKITYTQMLGPTGPPPLKYPGVKQFGAISTQDTAFGCGPGSADDIEATIGRVITPTLYPAWNGLLINMISFASIKIRRQLILRGIGSSLYSWQPDGSFALSALGKEKTGQFLADIANERAPLVAGKGLSFRSRLFGTVCLLGKSYNNLFSTPPSGPINPAPVLAARPDPTGCWTILDVASAANYEVGMHVGIHGVTGCGLTGLNGEARVVNIVFGNPVATPPTPDQIWIDRKPNCCVSQGGVYPIKAGSGFIYQIFKGLWGVGTAQGTRLVKKDTGTGTPVGTRGRRRKCRR